MSGNQSSGGRKRTASTGKNTKRKTDTQSRKTTERENRLWDEVLLVVLLVVTVFLFVSNLGAGGAVGSAVSGLMFGCFGLFAYLFPIVLMLLILFSLANRENWIASVKIGGTLAGCVDICALLHLLSSGDRQIEGLGQIFQYCKEYRTGGGLIGGGIFTGLEGAFGTAGAVLILLGVLIICAVIVTGFSFVSSMSKGSRKVYDTARQDMERRREDAKIRREQREEQRREQRTEKKISGVSRDLTIPKPEEREEISEKMPEEEVSMPVPEDAVVPELSFPVHKPSPVKKEEPQEISLGTGGIREIEFNEEDLLKNALSKRELEEEKAREQQREKKNANDVRAPEQEKEAEESAEYQFPPLSLLKGVKKDSRKKDSGARLQETAGHLQQILEDFGVNATVTDASQGPAVTRYEVQPAHGVKVNKIIALADDIKLNLAVPDVRIEAPIPGKAAVGIEVPNKENSVVPLRELLESAEFRNHPSRVAFAVGKDIGGNIMVSDIAKMPHLLIAGATGSGKSVCINTLIMSILYKARPDEVKLIMIDPKVVELSAYNGIPHLLIPVVTDPKKASGALNWAVVEMMDRYQKFAELNVRNIEGYNSKIDSIAKIEGGEYREKMPQIVIIVDELADLMMVAPGEVEDAICRLAQLARAAGIHLIIATQRPSVNVITGLIKANMPSRIAFAVSSGVDSRTILDMNGAEKLLGKGDMLFSPYGLPKPLRVQGAFVSDQEVGAVVEFLKNQTSMLPAQETDVEDRMKQVQASIESASAALSGGGNNDRDVLFVDAGKFIIEKDKASIGMLQRWFKIGFNRAARIMDQLAEAGVVGEEEGTKPRKVLMSMEEFEQYVDGYV
ncbi:cell division protein FtsK [Lachnoclostridium sp. An196]|uniref:FtsK/SpoIIIE family DNA translocase n=1 Tax=Lachnoclostridium sp. An196 TaxID=1965583 RepID=UPI000B3669B3|nr:DNA translocase FtsK [Lachnoclostridium sp. An196]OUP19936.1 cell division protein FtsK [Lachnoclostridium sp. An196]